MYTFTYDSQGSNSYLVYQLKDTDRIDSLSLGMITHNQIEGLLPTIYQQQNENQYFKYNISSRISLRQFYFDTVNRKQLLGTISGITNALLRAEEFMIDPDTLLLEMDYIFVDVSSCAPYMVCLPLMDLAAGVTLSGQPMDINEKMSAFLKEIIFRTQFDQSENLGYVAQIISFLNRPQPFSLPGFKEFLQQLAGTPVSQESAAAPYPAAGAPQAGIPQAAAPQAAPPPPETPYPRPAQTPAQQAGVPQADILPRVQVPPAPAGAPGPSAFTPPPQGAAGARPAFVPPVPPPQEKSSRRGRDKKKSPDMAVPPHAPAEGQEMAAPSGGEKKMSFMYLMMHYSKENKAIYDAQRKQKASAPQTQGSPDAPQVPFAVPGVKEGVPGSAQPYPPVPPKGAIPPQPPAPAPAPAGRAMPTPVPPPYPAPPQPQIKQQEYAYPSAPAQAPSAPPAFGQPQGGAAQPVSFGDTTSLSAGSIGETVVLSPAVAKEPQRLAPYLIRRNNQEQIPINKSLFRIGKEKSFVDYFIGDNTAISRSHAHIITRDGRFFVVDTNSTNHTYINGQMISPNSEAELNDGDELTLANEPFEFRLR